MNPRDLFDVIGELDEQYRLEALTPTPKQSRILAGGKHRIWQIASDGLRYAVIAVLLCISVYGAVKLRNIEQLLETGTPPEITEQTVTPNRELTIFRTPLTFQGERDNPAAHFPACNENLSVNNAICEGDSGWYYLVQDGESAALCFQSETAETPRVLCVFQTAVYDMTYYAGQIYAVLADSSGQAQITVIDPQQSDAAQWETVPLRQGAVPVACEIMCHGGMIWVSAGYSDKAVLYCYESANRTLHRIAERVISHGDVRAEMPHQLCGSGDRVYFLMYSVIGTNQMMLWEYSAESGTIYAKWHTADAYAVSDDVIWFRMNKEIREMPKQNAKLAPDAQARYKIPEDAERIRYQYADYFFYHDDALYFNTFFPYPDGETQLWNTAADAVITLPRSESYPEYGVAAAMTEHRIYAVAYDTVYYAEWDSAAQTPDEWKIAYSLRPNEETG